MREIVGPNTREFAKLSLGRALVALYTAKCILDKITARSSFLIVVIIFIIALKSESY